MKLTDKDVVKILEWLGWKFLPGGGYKKRDIWVSPDKEYELEHSLLPEYLLSAEGERVMMKRLKKICGYGLRAEFNVVTEGKWTCFISVHIKALEFGGSGETTAEALINAILEMIKDEKPNPST